MVDAAKIHFLDLAKISLTKGRHCDRGRAYRGHFSVPEGAQFNAGHAGGGDGFVGRRGSGVVACQFKTDAIRGEDLEIGKHINSNKCSEAADGVARDRKVQPSRDYRMR